MEDTHKRNDGLSHKLSRCAQWKW